MPSRSRRVRFERPPIEEVAISVLFSPVAGFTAARIGALWERCFRTSFPKTEDRPPLAPAVEEFGAVGPPKIEVSLLHDLPLRAWFLSEDGTSLLQVQADRFVRNWRRRGANIYPRYATLRDEFVGNVEAFWTGLRELDLAQPTLRQCELTYVDHIAVEDGGSHDRDLARLFSAWRWPQGLDALEPEQGEFSARYLMRAGSRPVGRVHVRVVPAFRSDDRRPIFVLTIVARGAPEASSTDALIAFLDEAHDRSLDVFLAVTTPAAQAQWGRVDDDD